MTNKLAPCPFCGMQSHQDWNDTLHPSGTGWREDVGIIDNETPFRHYLGPNQRDQWQGVCQVINCEVSYGGCGARITGDSEEEVINKWNRRH